MDTTPLHPVKCQTVVLQDIAASSLANVLQSYISAATSLANARISCQCAHILNTSLCPDVIGYVKFSRSAFASVFQASRQLPIVLLCPFKLIISLVGAPTVTTRVRCTTSAIYYKIISHKAPERFEG